MRIIKHIIVASILAALCCTEAVKISETLNLTVQSGSTLKYDIYKGSIPIEGFIEIGVSPKHAALSEIQTENGGIFYLYQPEANFVGTDIVMLDNYYSIGDGDVHRGARTELRIKVFAKEP